MIVLWAGKAMNDLRVYRQAKVLMFPSRHVRTPAWKRDDDLAMHESDPQKLPLRVKAAEWSIFMRWRELDDTSPNNPECRAMRSATNDLLSLKIQKLSWPDIRANS
jgi:hypothetical protein